MQVSFAQKNKKKWCEGSLDLDLDIILQIHLQF